MNSLVKVFSNFKEFYSEINGATLTGAIDVIVVEQPNGEYLCSPFHVRFGKLGVLRSREKIVDIEINGEPVDIHMKLGESGEAFFVEECPEEDIEQLPENLATSPIPSIDFPKYDNDNKKKFDNASEDLPSLPIPRRNSIDLSKECNDEKNEKIFENQISDFKSRRHTDNALERPDLSLKKKEFTTQKIRQEWAEHAEEQQIFQIEACETSKDNNVSPPNNDTQQAKRNDKTSLIGGIKIEKIPEKLGGNNDEVENKTKENVQIINNPIGKPDQAKKRRRKKSQLKKKNIQRKSSSSSSVSSITAQIDQEIEPDTVSITNGSSNDDESSSKIDDTSGKSGELKTAHDTTQICGDNSTNSSKTTISSSITEKLTSPNRCKDLDIHFFSDTEVHSPTRHDSRPSTPIQSDSEFEMQQRGGKNCEDPLSASWKWGELPVTPIEDDQLKNEPQSHRNSMLSGMFSFMKKANKIRTSGKSGPDGGVYLSDLVDADAIDPEMAALYFPSVKEAGSNMQDDDRESGNGTSLPHSPSSMEGGAKSVDSDFEEGGKPNDKYLDFVAISMCGGIEKEGGPTDDEFEQNIIKYSDVCQNPSLFSSPNLVVRLNGKYYSWTAACPIIMTIITFKKPLSNEAVEQLMNVSKDNNSNGLKSPDNVAIQEPKAAGYSSWFSWRRSAGGEKNKDNEKDSDQNAVATQTSRATSPNTDDISEKQDQNTEANIGNENQKIDLSNFQNNVSLDSDKGEKYRKTLRLSSEQIKSLNLKNGMNEIEFSVTTAYQGTSRCKCYLFRWKHGDKVVISDIDGTITKSDVLGHILPMVGKDWAQIGVAQLFTKIEENGYKLLYLSARAIGQSRATREYLRSIRQGDVKLPDGPLLLNPTSLISAFHREVIEKKPEQFKIACLSDIKALFPDTNPFYAGYGNRINDVWAYRAVGIPIMRIFTINTRGELKHELTQTFQSSYCSMSSIVDQLFPPIKADEVSIEYSNFIYWREPVPTFELDLNLAPLPITSNNTENN